MNSAGDILTVRDAIDVLAKVQPDGAFLIAPETGSGVSCEALRKSSILLANMLQQAGLERGDKVAFLMDNGLLTAQLFLGTMYGGFVAVPLNVRAGAMQMSYMLGHCDAKIVFVEGQYEQLLLEALEGNPLEIRVVPASGDGSLPSFEFPDTGASLLPLDGDDVAMLMYSSGSTGKPKAAIHTHSTVLAHGRNSIEAHELTASDRSLLVLPLYHINAECVTLIPTLLSGGSVVVARRFVVTRFWDWVDDLHVTWSALVPTIISELVNWDDPRKEARKEAFARIRFFRSSSAPLSPSLQRQFIDKFKLPLLQAMGSTEGGNIFSNPVPPAENKSGSPGLPWGFEVRLADRQGIEVPSGDSGEMLLRGPALMKGYYKDSEGTSAVVDSDGWFHTGDLARRDEDGYFFVVGRSKELIIKGGVNIAPRQIDEVLESHPAVLEAAAVGIPDRYFGEDAVAFVVLRPDAAAEEKDLLAFCETRLGHFKTPARVHFLSELPKGPSGKVQRLRLLDPEVLAAVALKSESGGKSAVQGAPARGEAGDPPSLSSIEQIIATAWSEVLGQPGVALDANFFALGGHSLLAIQCLSKLREKLPIVLSISDFFENLTIAEQAELVRQRLRPGDLPNGAAAPDAAVNWEQSLLQQFVPPPAETIPRREPSPLSPLSPAQEGLWFLQELNEDTPVYNEAEAVRLTGDLNVEALKNAMNQIVARHEVLRSTIRVVDGMPAMLVHESWPVRFEEVDLSALPAGERQSQVDRLLIEKPRMPYNLEAEPGIRITLLCLGQREHVLILMMHHIICDWSSEGIIWRELSALYRSLIIGEPVQLEALPVTNGDYAAWQRQRLTNQSFAEDLAYWEENLRGAPELLELPADRVRTPVMSHKGNRLRWRFGSSLTQSLRNTSRQEKISMFTIFATVLNALLYRYTGSEDILLGIPLSDREQQQLRSVVGFLLQTHVLRTRVSGDMAFRDLLNHVQKDVLELYTHRSVPFDQIVRRVQPQRNTSYTPLFQVMVNWRDRDQALAFIGLEGLAVDSLMAHSETTKFDMLFVATDWGDDIELELEYSSDLFDEDRIVRLLGHYRSLLEAVASDPGVCVAKMPLLTAGEYRQVVLDWNDTGSEFPADKCIHQLFEEQVERTPDATAVIFEDTSLSYAELNRRANRLARGLLDLGVQPDTRVAICAERSLEMVVGLLAILKAGGAYVPLDPSNPLDRLLFMIEDSAPVAVLTQTHLKGLFQTLGKPVPVIDLATQQFALRDDPAGDESVAPTGTGTSHLAYVIYTSGSTGVPKGVAVEHRSVVNGLHWMRQTYPLDPREAVLQKTPFAFDVSVWEFFWPLICGARLVMARPEGHKDPSYLVNAIRENKITTVYFVPSMLQAFLEHPEVMDLSSLTRIVCSGEALPAGLAQRFQQRLPGAMLLNLYGPTETAVHVTAWECPAKVAVDSIPIGCPIANTQMYILNDRLEPVPAGVFGELYIAGVQVARGYLNRPELTADKFILDPFSSEPGARMYRTGDLARYLADGNIEYLGRNDFQVKIRGFRIELGEIEARLAEHPGIRETVVLAREDTPGNKRLVAYYTTTGERPLDAGDLRSRLSAVLPEYMVPAAYVRLDTLPLTPNGKLDRKALPAPDGDVYAVPEYLAPRDPVEAKLVEIWEQVLGVRPIGIRANFFDVGGYSLMVMSLFGRINKAFNRSLPIASIFRFPTIEQLATQIRGCAIDAFVLVPIRPSGSKEPLFIVRSYLTYEGFRRVIEPERPLYGLIEREDDSEHLSSFEDCVAEYALHIRQLQPEGPYNLIGWCAAGPLTLEVARSLQASNLEVGMVGIIDGTTPAYARTLRRARKTRSFSHRIKAGINFYRNRQARYAATGKLRSLWKISWDEIAKRYNHVVNTAPTLLKVDPYDGRIVLFRVTETTSVQIDPTLGWGDIALKGVDVVWVPGDHETMFKDPHIAVFGKLLESALDLPISTGDGADHIAAQSLKAEQRLVNSQSR